MTIEGIEERIDHYLGAGKKIFVTSSFQTHSIPLLHLLSRKVRNLDVLFINTGFHFPKTITFRDQIVDQIGLQLIDVHSVVPKSQQRDADGHFYFVADPDYCCFLNKVQPLDPYLAKYDVWITGVRADQSQARQALQVEQQAPHNTIKFHPLLDWTAKQIYQYRMQHRLPEHPLDKEGYQSIGCTPCTRKFDLNDERSARWFGLNKTECGLHKDLVASHNQTNFIADKH